MFLSVHSPSFEIVDTTDALLRVLHHLREQEGKRCCRDLGIPCLVQRSVIYVRAYSWFRCRRGRDRGRGRQ